jgi:hypothetical protein
MTDRMTPLVTPPAAQPIPMTQARARPGRPSTARSFHVAMLPAAAVPRSENCPGPHISASRSIEARSTTLPRRWNALRPRRRLEVYDRAAPTDCR